MTFETLEAKLKAADGFMLTVSILTNDILEHSIITEKFRKIDMIPSHKRTQELIIKELESPYSGEFSFLND